MSGLKELDVSEEERHRDIIAMEDLTRVAIGLQDIHRDLIENKNIYRPIAAAIESLSEGTLGVLYPIGSFTLTPSQVNLKVAQEAVAERLKDVLKRIFTMLAEVYKKVVEFVTRLIERIFGREAEFNKEMEKNGAYRKANSLMLSNIAPEAKQKVAERAKSVEQIITDLIADNYNDLFDSFINKGDIATAQLELNRITIPYLEYVLKRMRKYIDLSYDMARFQGESQVDQITKAISELSDEEFEGGSKFTDIVKKIPLSREFANDQTFAAYLSGYKAAVKEMKGRKEAKPVSYKTFSQAKLWDIKFDNSKAIQKYIGEIERLAKRLDSLTSSADSIDKDVLRNYTQLGKVIRREAYSVLDLAAVLSEFWGIKLIGIRLERNKAKAMYDVISKASASDVAEKAKDIVKDVDA